MSVFYYGMQCSYMLGAKKKKKKSGLVNKISDVTLQYIPKTQVLKMMKWSYKMEKL